MYRFAVQPRWLLSHAFALFLVVLFVNLGFWQLSRHEARAERNELVRARTQLPAGPVDGLVARADTVDELRYRRATAEGRFVPGADVLVDNRSNQGLPGVWVVTPLQLDDGSVVAVNRGFQGFDDGQIVPPPPPPGRAEVAGTLVSFVDRSCGTRRGPDGEVVGTACLQRDAVERGFGTPVLPIVLQRSEPHPTEGDVLQPVPLPDLDTGPHRSYAVQWFIFAAIGAVGYPLILRRVARDRAAGRRVDDALDELVASG